VIIDDGNVTVDNDDAMIDNGAATVDNTVDDSDVIVDDDGVMMPLQRTRGHHHAHHQTPCLFSTYSSGQVHTKARRKQNSLRPSLSL